MLFNEVIDVHTEKHAKPFFFFILSRFSPSGHLHFQTNV
jgi:hypothetical protein